MFTWNRAKTGASFTRDCLFGSGLALFSWQISFDFTPISGVEKEGSLTVIATVFWHNTNHGSSPISCATSRVVHNILWFSLYSFRRLCLDCRKQFLRVYVSEKSHGFWL